MIEHNYSLLKVDNKIIVNLNHVQHAKFYYLNQYGQTSTVKPKHKTYRNILLTEFLKETQNKLIKENFIDVFIPVLKLQLTANHSLTYTREKAISIYKAFCEKQFKPIKK